MYGLTYLAVALRTARWHWESIGQGHKWRIFDALVLADADPSTPPRPERAPRRVPRSGWPLPGQLRDDDQAIDPGPSAATPAGGAVGPHHGRCGFAEWKEILCDGQLTALGWLRWAAPVGMVQSPTASASQTASIGLAVEAREQTRAQSAFLFDEDDSRELQAEFDDDRLRVAQSVHLALPFSVYLGVPEMTEDRSVSPRSRWAWSEAQVKETLQAILTRLNDGGPSADPDGLIERMRLLKRYGKQIHHAAIHGPSDSQPTTPEFGQLLYTLASAVALVGTGRRIDSLNPRMLAGNITWALERPRLDPRLAPILHQAHSRLVGTGQVAG